MYNSRKPCLRYIPANCEHDEQAVRVGLSSHLQEVPLSRTPTYFVIPPQQIYQITYYYSVYKKTSMPVLEQCTVKVRIPSFNSQLNKRRLIYPALRSLCSFVYIRFSSSIRCEARPTSPKPGHLPSYAFSVLLCMRSIKFQYAPDTRQASLKFPCQPYFGF